MYSSIGGVRGGYNVPADFWATIKSKMFFKSGEVCAERKNRFLDFSKYKIQLVLLQYFSDLIHYNSKKVIMSSFLYEMMDIRKQ